MIDGWVLVDFRGSNPVFAQRTGGRRWSTRRAFLWEPTGGEPVLLHSAIDRTAFADLPLRKIEYVGWREMDAVLAEWLGGKTVAVEWSPDGAVPHVDYLSAGMRERLERLGATLVPSAEIVMAKVAEWSDDAVASHDRAMAPCASAMEAAFDLARKELGRITEYDLQQFIERRLTDAGLETDHPAIVAVGPHAGDPHYSPGQSGSTVIGPGCELLVDLWGREPVAHGTFADITWIAVAGGPSAEHARMATAAFRARDAALELAADRWAKGVEVRGWELDRAAADVLIGEGFGHGIKTRTGHSLSPGPQIHGLGFHLDDLETRDERPMRPRLGFTVEPGVYLDSGGVRTEVDVWVDPVSGPRVTSPIQTSLVRLD